MFGHFKGDGRVLFEQAVIPLKLEGPVAKAADGVYRPGVRSADWVKVKRKGAIPAQRYQRGPRAWRQLMRVIFLRQSGKTRTDRREPCRTLFSRTRACIGISTAATKVTDMTLEAMTFADDPNAEILDHMLTDEYAAALEALQRGEPQARSRVLAAYEHLRARSTDRLKHP